MSDVQKINETLMDVTEIRRFLAHRYPMLLVDRVIQFESGKGENWATCTRCSLGFF